jgi:uncharacterized membrane protein
MESDWLMRSIEFLAKGLEFFGVAVIATAFFHAMVIRVILFGKETREEAWQRLRLYMGKALQLGLEFLVAADIIRTVTVRPTIQEIAALGLLIVVRTFLSWSITVENEGCWPWQAAKLRKE